MAVRFTLISTLLVFEFVSFAQYSKRDLKIARETYHTITTTKGFYDDKYLLALIDHVGRSLEVHMEEHFHFQYFLVDDPTPNAFATTGGLVYINRGLFLHINDEDELAGVMAHELIHITKHHVSKRVSAEVLPNLLQLPANFLGLLTYKEVAQVINAPIKAASGLVTNGFNRTQESEADKHGVELAYRSGYDPYALTRVLKRLNKHKKKKGKFSTQIFMDHPMTETRIADIELHLDQMNIEPSEVLSGTSLQVLDGLCVDQNPKAGLFNGTQFMHPDLGFSFHLPDGWSVQNSPVSVTAISPDKKSTLVVSVDWENTSPYSAANLDLQQLKKSEIMHSFPDTTNGLLAYRATIRDKRVKYSDLISEYLWVKIPSSQAIIKIVGVSNYNTPDSNILESFSSFRELNTYDKKEIEYPFLDLLLPTEHETFEQFVQRNGLSWQIKIIKNLNELDYGQLLSKDRWIKTIKFQGID